MTPLLPAVAGLRASFAGEPRRNVVYNVDALTLLRALPSGSVQLIASDPPYGIDYATSRMSRHDGSKRTMSRSFGDDEIQLDWLFEAARVLDDTGALYIFTRWDVAHIWKSGIEAAGLKVSQRLVWDKSHWGSGDLRYYGSQTEDILFCPKSNHDLRWQKRQGNVWCTWKGYVWEDGAVHPTQKPVRIMAKMIVNSSGDGDLIVDPFAGSGSTLVAAQKLGRHYIGGDISAAYCDVARARLAQPYTLPLFAANA